MGTPEIERAVGPALLRGNHRMTITKKQPSEEALEAKIRLRDWTAIREKVEQVCLAYMLSELDVSPDEEEVYKDGFAAGMDGALEAVLVIIDVEVDRLGRRLGDLRIRKS